MYLCVLNLCLSSSLTLRNIGKIGRIEKNHKCFHYFQIFQKIKKLLSGHTQQLDNIGKLN